MLISSHGRFIFVHVQKTGGVSLEDVLSSHYSDTSSWHGRHGHARSGLDELGIDRWKSYFSFGFVRNPWDRLVSYYSMIRAQIDALPPEERKSPRPFDLEIWNQVA